MNSTQAISQSPAASDANQPGAAALANSVNSGGKDRDFAATLSKAGARPARKSAAHGAGDSGPDGRQLPATGNFSPPPTMPVAASGTTAEALVGERAGRQGSTDGPGPAARIGSFAGATAAQSGAGANAAGSGRQVREDRSAPGASNAAPGDAPAIRGAASVPAGFALSLGMPTYVGEPDVQGAGRGAPAGTASAAAPVGVASQDLGLTRAVDAAQELAVPQVAAAADGTASANASATATLTMTEPAALAATAARSVTRAPLTAAAATAADNAATSAPAAGTGSAATLANIAAWTATDLTPQGAAAAAMAAATGIVADNSAATDSTLAPPTGLSFNDPGAAMNATGMNGAAAPGFPIPAVGSAAAAAAASAAASTAGAVTASAGTGAAEKHTDSEHGDSPTSDASSGSLGVTQLSVNSAGAADVAAAPTVKVAAGVGTPEFGQGLADRVSWMVNNNLSSAKLQVNPPQLGPIEVRISVQGDHAQVWLTSHSVVTRDALQSSAPNLREMLGAQGFGQVSVDISQRNFQDRSAYAQPYERTLAAEPSSATVVSATVPLVPRFSNGAVDAYA